MDQVRGLYTTMSSFIVGTVLPVFDKITKAEIIFWLQVASFTVAIVAGIYTINKSRRKNGKG